MIALKFVSDLPILTGYFYSLSFNDSVFFIVLSLVFAILSYYNQSEKQSRISERSEVSRFKKFSFFQIGTAFLIVLILLWLPFYKFIGIDNF